MIVSMKKALILVQSKDAQAAVSKLRSLGILHVEHIMPPAGEDIARIKGDLDAAAAAISILSRQEFLKLSSGKQTKPADWKFVANHLIDLNKRLQQLEDYSRVLNATISEWEQWGDFDPRKIEKLAEKNIYIRLYRIPFKEVKQMPAGVIVKEIFRRAEFAYCAVISEGKPALPFKEVPLPKMGLEQVRARAYEDQRMKELVVDDISRYSVHLEALIKTQKDLEKQLEFHEVVRGMGRQGAFTYLSGYLPSDQAGNLEAAAQKEQWGLLVRDPSIEESPPVLLRNPRWVRLIQPVLKLLGIVPGYRELDVSPVFLIFFSIFVGILIGDAGYGLAYLCLTFFFQKKKGINQRNASIFFLLYLLSSSAIIWGILTGVFFGQEWLLQRGIRPLVPALNDASTMQKFCFFIGALHLTIAHAWRGILKFPGFAFLADVGWIAILWVAFFLADALILGGALPGFCLPMAVLGIILVLLFNEPRKNLFKRLGAGFTSVTFGLSFMSTFTDVVSYVRLFAVGLAGLAIANTTNTMAAGLDAGIAGFGAGMLIRILGHALNIVLGPIAILVHGVRLNVLEFGLNHTNITWSGSLYRPLQETS